MKYTHKLSAVCMLLLLPMVGRGGVLRSSNHSMPHLRKTGHTTQLIVDGKPFLILGGELGNSSFTSLEYMAPIWPKLKAMHLNTVLAPVYWELIEPQEGRFEFDLYDRLIAEARKNDLKLVLLWFGSWKNSMSSHAPGWVKRDQARFPRAKDAQGRSLEILTPFSQANRQADVKAFRALMSHLKKIDAGHRTVLMIQVENEIGMLPSARDHHPLAEQKFGEAVPAALLDHLQQNLAQAAPELREAWEQNGRKKSGTWEEVFGRSAFTEELFMAWHFAEYTEAVAGAGKAVYPLPMFVNAALNRPGRRPGEGYPSGGPLPHVMDAWKAAAPSIDFFSPDIYFPDFQHWCDLYVRNGNPLFIPEHRFDETAAAKASYAFGRYEAIGFSPFSIESTNQPEKELIGKLYRLIDQLTPTLTAHHGRGRSEGVLLDKDRPESVFRLGDYEFTVRHSYTLGYEKNSRNDTWEAAGAVVIQTGDSEFYMAGWGVVATFTHARLPHLNVGILKTEEGRFEKGAWKVIRHLNGDQTHQGRHVRIFVDDCSIVRFELYTYE